MNNMDKKTKRALIVIGIVFFVFSVLFSAYAGINVGEDIGEFIYNITH